MDERQQQPPSPADVAGDIFQKILAGPAPGDLDDLLRGLDKINPACPRASTPTRTTSSAGSPSSR